MSLPPAKRTIIPPEQGWEECSYYEVEVSFEEHNPIHRSIFYSGFLNKTTKDPQGYNSVWNPTYEGTYELSEVHYLKVVKKLNFEGN